MLSKLKKDLAAKKDEKKQDDKRKAIVQLMKHGLEDKT
jgi:hypothetical protein